MIVEFVVLMLLFDISWKKCTQVYEIFRIENNLMKIFGFKNVFKQNEKNMVKIVLK